MKTPSRRDGMKRPAKGLCLIGLGFFVTFFGGRFDQSARAADGQLLVVVEAPPALETDAEEIRRAIGAELHARTIAPMSTPAEAPGRALIVALDRDRIAMSLRANDGTSVVRVIPAPVERGARLRAIAWLAGNLARDQVSPILAEGPAESSPSATIPAPPATPVATRRLQPRRSPLPNSRPRPRWRRHRALRCRAMSPQRRSRSGLSRKNHPAPCFGPSVAGSDRSSPRSNATRPTQGRSPPHPRQHRLAT